MPDASLVLQDRDIAFLRGLFEARVMTAEHVAALYFDGRGEYTKKRLQKLKTAGLVAVRPRKPFEPAVLFLTRAGLVPLHERGVLQEYPEFDLPALERRARVSDLTLRHELEVMDVKVAFHASLKQTPALTVAEFNTWPLLNQFLAVRSRFEGADVMVRPDGFIRIRENEADGGVSEHSFFLEVDRSTETQETLVFRAECYLNYYKSGGFADKNGGARSAFKEYPFRVLFVFKSAERRNNTAERLLLNSPPIFTQVCLSTIDEVTREPLGAVWIQPKDYRSAVVDTPFDIEGPRYRPADRRQPMRDAFIEKNVPKFRLLSD